MYCGLYCHLIPMLFDFYRFNKWQKKKIVFVVVVVFEKVLLAAIEIVTHLDYFNQEIPHLILLAPYQMISLPPLNPATSNPQATTSKPLKIRKKKLDEFN